MKKYLKEATAEENKILYDFMQSNKRTIPANVQDILDKYELTIDDVGSPANRRLVGKQGRTTRYGTRGHDIKRTVTGHDDLAYGTKLDYEAALNAPLPKELGTEKYNRTSRKDTEQRIQRDWKYSRYVSPQHINKYEKELEFIKAKYEAGDISRNEFERQSTRLIQNIEFEKEALAKNKEIRDRETSLRKSEFKNQSIDDEFSSGTPNIRKLQSLNYDLKRAQSDIDWHTRNINERTPKEIADLEKQLAELQAKIDRYKKDLESEDSYDARELKDAQSRLDNIKQEKNKLLRRGEKIENLKTYNGKLNLSKLIEDVSTRPFFDKISDLLEDGVLSHDALLNEFMVRASEDELESIWNELDLDYSFEDEE